MSADYRYHYCGIELRSDFLLPELPALRESEASPVLHCRQVETLPGAKPMEWISPVLGIGEESLIWQLPGVARFLLSRSEPLIEVEAAPGVDWQSIRLFLLHPVFTLARMLQGDFLLRAACVAIDGQAVALVGPPAGGKTTLAAALNQQGHQLLSDGLLRITKDAHGTPVAFPQASWLLLWPDALKKLEMATYSTQAVRSGLALARVNAEAGEQPLPIRRILMVREQRGNDQELFASEESCGLDGFQMIRHFTAGRFGLQHLGQLTQHFQWSVELAQAARRERLDLPWGWERFEECIAGTERWCRQ